MFLLTMKTTKRIAILLLLLAKSGLSFWGAGPNRSIIRVETPEKSDADNTTTRGTNEPTENEINNDSHESYKLFYSEKDEIEEIYSRTTPRRLGARFQTFVLETRLRIRNSLCTWMERNQMMAPERAIVNVYKNTLPAVAELHVYHATNSTSDGSRIHVEELENDQVLASISTVSGFLWDGQGHVVTNYHCLYGTDREEILKVKVKFPDLPDLLDAKVVGSDPSRDVAVVKISSKQYNPALSNPLKHLPKPIPKGSSRFLQVGQTCLALGVPKGHSNTLTVGVVSGLNKQTQPEGTKGFRGCILTDALLGPGNSGGPLLDTRGRLIGINFCANEDLRQGFAIAVDTAKRVVSQLIHNGHAEMATTGIVFTTDDLPMELELCKGSVLGGVMIRSVPRNSPADHAGLQCCVLLDDSNNGGTLEARDLIVGVDGKRVTSGEEFFGTMDSKLPGQTALITVSRVARIGDMKRWNEVIPIQLITLDELCEMSEEVRKIVQEDNDEGSND